MREIMIRLFFSSLIAVFLFACVSSNSRDLQKRDPSTAENMKINLENIIEQHSIFNGDRPPRVIPRIGGNYDYNPVIVSLQASLLSRDPRHVKDLNWDKVPLPTSGDNDACQGVMPAFFRQSPNSNAPTFVIFPGAFASWGRGSFTHQTVEYLEQKYNSPNFIAFIGYLNKSALKDTCDKVPWDGLAYAKDLRRRIKIFLSQKNVDLSKVGGIGYSGGAYLVSMITGIDGMNESKELPLLSKGAMAFSPILDSLTTFEILDRQHLNSKIALSKGLIDLNFLVKVGWWRLRGRQRRLEWIKFHENSAEVEDRFYNMFKSPNLTEIVKFVGLPKSVFNSVKFSSRVFRGRKNVQNLATGYEAVFIDHGMMVDLPKTPEKNKQVKFRELTNIVKTVRYASKNLFIYFSQDDPVLSAPKGEKQPEIISETLRELQSNPNIFTYNPKFGAHTGALLDPAWEPLIATFFEDMEN